MKSTISHKTAKNKRNHCDALPLIALCCSAFVACITAFGFFTNFDITDEGYVFHHHIHGPSEVYGLLGLHFFTHPIGFLFGHQLIGYRLLDLFLFIILSFYLTASIRLFLFNKENINSGQFTILFSFIAIAAMGYFVFMPSGHYNALSIMAGMGWSASLLFYTHYIRGNQSSRYFYLIGLVVFTVVAFLSKFPFGFCLALCFPFFFVAISLMFKVRKYQDIFIYLILLSLGAVIIYFCATEFWKNFAELLTFSESNNMLDNVSGDGYLSTLLGRYLNHFNGWFIKDFLPVFAILFGALCVAPLAAQKTKIQILQSNPLWSAFAILAVVVFAFLAIDSYVPEKPRYFQGQNILRILMAVFVSVSIFYAVSFWRKTEYQTIIKDIIFCIITVAVVFGHPVGTNTNFMSTLSLSLGSFAAIFFIFYFFDSHKFQEKKGITISLLIGMTILVGYGVARNQIFYSYRNAPLSQQTTYSQYSPYLKHIKIEKSYATVIDNLWLALEKENFDFKKDQIFAYQDMPGLLSAVGAKSFSEAWLISGYKNSVARTCLHVDFENMQDADEIYILSNASLDTKDLNCFFDRVKKSDNYTHYDIGQFWHYRSHRQVDIKLSGPYILR